MVPFWLLAVPATALLLVGPAGCALAEHGGDGDPGAWELHTARGPGYTYTVEYPAGWAVEEDGAATHFRPPEGGPTGAVTVVVIDEEETPPLPVHVTYDTLRVIERGGRSIPVLSRDPSAATERYVALLREGPFTTEVRLTLPSADTSDEPFRAVFDHMALSLSLSPDR